jgi:integral membrane protein (TIGR01906 family)
VGTVLAIIALALLPLLTPWFTHAALDAAGSAELLGLAAAEVHELSDRSIEELVLGPGSFEISGPDGQPFYDEDERRHLGDARLLLGLALILGGLSIVGIGAILARGGAARRSAAWATISSAGLVTAIVVVALGVVALVAFDSLFRLFHQVFFPGGNWSFDPATQRLVQLYPFRFWQIAAAALGVLVFGLGIATWLLGRWLARRRAGDPPSAPADPPSAPADSTSAPVED